MKKTKQTKHKPSARLLTLLLACTMVFTMMPGMVWADENPSVVTVSSSSNLPSTIDAGTIVKLDADITLAIGQQIENLEGVLDGQGHTITLANKPLANNVKGTIQNLLVTSEDVIKDSKTFGAMAVTLTGTIRNCGCTAKLELEGWIGSVGGVVGAFNDGIIQNVYFAGNVVDYEGAIAGAVQKGTKAHNSYYTIGMGPNTNCETKNCEKVKADDLKAGKINKKLNNDLPDTGFYWASPDEGSGFPILKPGKPPVAKEELTEKIATAKNIENDNYTDASWKKLQDTITEAETLAGEETVTQQQVDDMVSKLSDAISGLLKNKITEPVAPPKDEKEIKHIKTADELQNIKSPGYYVLDNDLTLGDDMYWAENTFNGVLEGNGHTITLKDSFTGIFDSVGPDGVVQNLYVTGSSNNAAGGIVNGALQGVIINCYTDIVGTKVSGFAKELKGGAIINSYSVSKGKNGALFKTYESGFLKNTYWREDLSNTAINQISEENLIDSSAKSDAEMKSKTFVALLNGKRGTHGVEWGQNAETGYPYFGGDQEYVPEWERPIPPNKTEIAFTPSKETNATVIENQQLTVNLSAVGSSTSKDFAGTFSLPNYTLKENESITWSCTVQNPENSGAIAEGTGAFYTYKKGRLNITATLHKADNTIEVLATVKVNIVQSKIAAIKIYLADDKGKDAAEIQNGNATVQGSEWKTVVVKAQYEGESDYQTLSSNSWELAFTAGQDNIIQLQEGSKTFQFNKPSTATVKVTTKDNKAITATAEITSKYVAVNSVKPGHSGVHTIHGRGSMDDGSDYLALYDNAIVVEPANASANHYHKDYTVTSGNDKIAKFFNSLPVAYIPYAAGNVTYTATLKDGDKTCTGTAEAEYVYKNKLKSVTVDRNEYTVKANESVALPLKFEGELTDGTTVTEKSMNWTYDKPGIVEIERESGVFKTESGKDKGFYFPSNVFKIFGLDEGTVIVTGTPVDQTGGAKAVTFTVTVTPGQAEVAADNAKLIADGIKAGKNYWATVDPSGVASFGNEWYFFDRARSGVTTAPEVLERYLQDVNSTYAKASLSMAETKPTTLARVILTLGALGENPEAVGGKNLIEMLYNSNGIGGNATGNEAMWALIALDSGKYKVPENAKWTREKLITEVLRYKTSDNGFALTQGQEAGVDTTAMAIQALAPYYQKDENVKTAVNNALEYLKSEMNRNCQYESSEAGAQVLIALTALGLDPVEAKNGFVKSAARNLISGLDKYRVGESGFKHLLADEKINPMASGQALEALEACRRLKADEVHLYDLSDVNIKRTLENRVAEAEALASKQEYYGAALWQKMIEAKEAAKKVLAQENPTDTDLKKADKALADALAALYAYNPKPGVAADDIIVNVTIAEQGKLAVGTQKDGKHQGEAIAIAAVPITVQDRNKDGTQDIDEVLYAIHERYYAGGAAAGYECSSKGWLAKLWGKNASASGMWINNVAAGTGLKDNVKAGDNVSVFTYKDTINYSDKFTKFNQTVYTVDAGKDVSVNVQAAGFDQSYQTVWAPAGSVTISLLNGKVLAATDVAGNAKISGLAQGTHKLVASTADGLMVPTVATIVVKDPAAPQDKVSMRVADPKGKTYLPKTSYDFVSGETVYSLLTKSGLRYEAKYYGMYGGYYVQKIEGLGEFDKGAKSGWMYRVNGVYPEVSCSEYKLRAGDHVEWLYTADLGKDIGASSEQKTDVTTSGAAGGGTTTAPTEVAVTEKTNADGAKEIVAAVTVKKENQTEILKQAKENQSKEIVLEVAAAASRGADSIQMELPKDMVSDIVRDTQAEVTVDSEQGALTLDRETLAQIAKEAKGSALTLTIQKAKSATEAQQKLTGAATQVYRLTLASANQNISQFDGKITVKLPIPATLLEKTVVAVHFDSAEKFTQMQGKRESRNKKDFYVFATTHFSEFGLVDAEEAGITENDAQEPETDKLSNRKEAKKIVSKLRLTTTASKTKKQSVKLQMKQNSKTRKQIKALQSIGYSVKYRFYRSTKKRQGYQRLATKKTNAYTVVKGKKGTRYYYKTQLCVYDKEGKLIAKTALKQSKYAEKVWTKKAKAKA